MKDLIERVFTDTPRICFDSRIGINEILTENGTEKGLEIISAMRKEYADSNHDNGNKMISFVVDQEWMLDRHGNVHHIVHKVFKKGNNLSGYQKDMDRVMFAQDFLEATGIKSYEVEEYL